MDSQTGQVLHAENPDKVTHPASLTKMMTLYMIFSALDQGRITLDTPMRVSAHAARQIPSKLGLKNGETILLRDAIMALITKSANDAAVVVAEKMGGSEGHFADIMTAKAHQLGMNSTYFRNASGVPNPQQITTTRDMAVLSRALIREFSHHYHLFKTKSFTYRGRSHRNHNKLAGEIVGQAEQPVVVDGIKTGFVNASGYNLAASALHGNKRLIVVVMGGTSGAHRDKRIKDLVTYYFNAKPISNRSGGSKLMLASRSATKEKATGPQALPIMLAQASQKKLPTLQKVLPVLLQASHTKASAQKAKPASGWAVQVGAFRKLNDARKALRVAKLNAPNFIQPANLVTVPSKVKRRTMYRAQLAGLTHSQAEEACQAFANKGLECLTLKSHRS